jgi:hypothetical protein
MSGRDTSSPTSWVPLRVSLGRRPRRSHPSSRLRGSRSVPQQVCVALRFLSARNNTPTRTVRPLVRTKPRKTDTIPMPPFSCANSCTTGHVAPYIYGRFPPHTPRRSLISRGRTRPHDPALFRALDVSNPILRVGNGRGWPARNGAVLGDFMLDDPVFEPQQWGVQLPSVDPSSVSAGRYLRLGLPGQSLTLATSTELPLLERGGRGNACESSDDKGESLHGLFACDSFVDDQVARRSGSDLRLIESRPIRRVNAQQVRETGHGAGSAPLGLNFVSDPDMQGWAPAR